MANGGEKTEKPTGHRRQQARDDGQIARSMDLPAAAALAALLAVLALSPLQWALGWRRLFAGLLRGAAAPHWSVLAAARRASLLVAWWSGPAMAAAWVAAIAASVAQGGWILSAKPFQPDVKRLNPVTNIQNLFSAASVSRLLKSLAPAGAILYVAYATGRGAWPRLLTAMHGTAAQLLTAQLGWMLTIAWKSALILVLWGSFDYLMQRRTFTQRLKMTKEEVKHESRDLEGNPEIKGRQRRMRRVLYRRIMLREVPRATVVVVNPTEYAIALRYEPDTMAAPVVIAKGREYLARQIKEIARWHGIPAVENPPLAHALYRAVEVGQAIPPSLYAAVAEILAFIFAAQAQLRPAARPA
jgi:flagellar biosynthetic protein FlhB